MSKYGWVGSYQHYVIRCTEFFYYTCMYVIKSGKKLAKVKLYISTCTHVVCICIHAYTVKYATSTVLCNSTVPYITFILFLQHHCWGSHFIIPSFKTLTDQLVNSARSSHTLHALSDYTDSVRKRPIRFSSLSSTFLTQTLLDAPFCSTK
jgi:hypothetical protein